jgi:hypothetical protein
MIHYKDKTFCSHPCVKECSRKLTKQIKEKAKSFGLPICSYIDRPPCFKGVKDEKQSNYL